MGYQRTFALCIHRNRYGKRKDAVNGQEIVDYTFMYSGFERDFCAERNKYQTNYIFKYIYR